MSIIKMYKALFLLLTKKIFEVPFFTTITSRLEFLDYFRKMEITYGLIDCLTNQNIKLTIATKTCIESIKGREEARRKRNQGKYGEAGSCLFTDSEIKEAKKAFTVLNHSGKTGWLKFCETYIDNKLTQYDHCLGDLCHYLLPNNENQKEKFFQKALTWSEAVKYSEKTGMGTSDSMLFNTFICSNLPIMLSSDLDIAYSVKCDNTPDKIVVTPIRILSELKKLKRPF